MDDLYTEKINEFTDWVSGENSLTKGNDTNNLPVAGSRIRELLQNHLKEPIYLWRDTTENLYRIFSSIDAWRIWDSDRTRYSNLELANFVAPSEYGIQVTFPENGTVLYTREGVHDENTIISYSWKVVDGKENELDENMYITYDIIENGTHLPTTKTPSNKNVREDLYEYLSTGLNTIEISFKGADSGAETKKTVTVYVIKLNISTDFDYTAIQRNLSTLNFSLYADRNVQGPLSFKTCRYYYGTGIFNNTVAQEQYENTFNIKTVDENNLTPSAEYQESGSMEATQLKAGLHAVQVLGRMLLNNNQFNSNLLYYLFGVSYPTGGEQMYHGVAVECNFNGKIDFIGPSEFMLNATQYEQLILNWGYISYIGGMNNNISWYMRNVNDYDPEDIIETFITTIECSSNIPATPLQYLPVESTALGRSTYLVAKISGNDIIQLPIYIKESTLGISETGGVDLKLKLSAYGKLNENADATSWTFESYSTTFSNVKWNTASGWYNNSLRLSGATSSAVIDYNPFENIDASNKGATIEVEFESEYVSSTDEELIRLGSPLNSEPHISIYANKAQLFIQGAPIITTNYKTNERVKLAFIIEPRNNVSNEIKNVIFIVNNGICERAAGWKDYEPTVFSANAGNITIGNCNSGIRVYNIRCYTKAITILNAYNNFVYDSDNKAAIVGRNDIYVSGEINLSKCQDKLDVIILKGPLNKVLSRNTTKDGSNSECNIQRICAKDHSKDFTVTHGRIRKHGQSTLNYPLTSYKLWTWSSIDEVRPSLTIGSSEDLPFSKNRYQMKTNSIPANKFVLQANYADSSGTHNGGFLRLIQDIWYNSQIDGEYKLRTQPQLFSSNQTISVQLGDSMTEEESNLFRGMNSNGKQWKDYFGNVVFPYTIRNAPDSFPCLVFYQNEDAGDTSAHFLGQYVFMDDKKSDYTYGQRSIYKVDNTQSGTNNANDPFCIKRDPKTGDSIWDEKSGTKIWDNDKVLRIECLSVNSTLADFRGVNADNSGRRFDNVILGTTENDTSIGWEEDFELVYPEKEEITSSKKFDPNKFVTTVQPFTDWLQWIISTYQNQSQFEATAAQHLDLYKMAAYYIFVLRFGLVDSLERNAQLKTYDGKHWHYEPWDMDIALGNRNTGGIAFDPPIDRNTMMDSTTGAISGRSVIDTNNDEIPDTTVSNWLFDALESWDYWINEIVPKVADAMYKQGLTYTNVINMLDGQYQDAWCETIYNETGNFKYVVNRQNVDSNGNILEGYDDSWLSWLQGARTTHRHWWLKSSMDYYDAKWGVGEFMEKNMYIGCEMHNVQGHINVVPTSSTYFSFEREATKFGPFAATPDNPLTFDVSSINSGAKVPFKMYGANFIKEIDISDVASGLQVFSIANAYSSEVGPIITKVNIGVKVSQKNSNTYTGQENNKEVQIAAGNSLNAIEELNIRGQRSSGLLGTGRIQGLDFIANTKTIQKIYAMGAGMNTLNSCIGTDFEVLELPDTITSITFNSTTWNPDNLSFWHTTSGGFETKTYTDIQVDDQGNVVYDEQGNPVMEEYTVQEMNPATYTKFNLNDSNIKVSIPRGLLAVKMTGTTGRNLCSRQFVGDWINSIIKWGTEDWNYHLNGAQDYNSLNEYLTHLFNERSLSIENIYWDNSQIPGLSYEQLSWVAKFNNIDYSQTYTNHPNVKNFSKGYVVLTDNNTLTGIQTSYLSTWFGEGVFVLNSNGLVIDQQKEYTTVSVGPSAYVENNEIYIKEGNSARIQATRFNLRPSLAATEFSLADPNSTLSATSYEYPKGSGSIASSIVSNQVGEDILYYLKTEPNITGQDYNVKLISGSGNVIIHVKALDYPEEIFLSVQGDKKTEDSGSGTSFYKYDKGFDVFVLGQQSGQFQVGVQFKENGKWVNTPENKALTISYAKFKIYKEGVLCSKFEYAKDYTDFIQAEQTIQNFVDQSDTTLSYTTGYRAASDVYKYYIPLYVQGTVGQEPLKYRVDCEIKIGGMIKTLSANLVLIKDFIVAPEGNPIWGLINHSYVQQKESNYDRGSFYRSITDYITEDISVDGKYNKSGTWTVVKDYLQNTIYNGHSIFEYLPNISGIKLDDTEIESTVEGIPNLNLQNVSNLSTFSIKDCEQLTDIVDLSTFTDLKTVNASGTGVSVLIPENSENITNYTLGAPSEISIINPQKLQPLNVTVQYTTNLSSLTLKNIPQNKTYAMFDKIFSSKYFWIEDPIARKMIAKSFGDGSGTTLQQIQNAKVTTQFTSSNIKKFNEFQYFGNTTNIADFSNCKNLQEITLPVNMKIIPTFINCENLTKINISSNSRIQSIPGNCVFGCTSLKRLELLGRFGDSVYIGHDVFSGTPNLKIIIINQPVNMTNLYNVNNICENRAIIMYNGFSISDNSQYLFTIGNTTKLFVPDSLVQGYKTSYRNISNNIYPISQFNIYYPDETL